MMAGNSSSPVKGSREQKGELKFSRASCGGEGAGGCTGGWMKRGRACGLG